MWNFEVHFHCRVIMRYWKQCTLLEFILLVFSIGNALYFSKWINQNYNTPFLIKILCFLMGLYVQNECLFCFFVFIQIPQHLFACRVLQWWDHSYVQGKNCNDWRRALWVTSTLQVRTIFSFFRKLVGTLCRSF